MSQLPRRIVLIGPSGAGKSEVARLIAKATGFAAIDIDDEITRCSQMTIADIFSKLGEPAFRALESQVVAEACERTNVVVATGGGAVLAPANWARWRPESAVVALMAAPEILIDRVRRHAQQAGEEAERPLLAGDAEQRMRAMLTARGALYASADITIRTDELAPEQVAALVVSQVRELSARDALPVLSLSTSGERSDIFVGAGLIDHAGDVVTKRWPRARRAWIITDEHVGPLWSDRLAASLSESGMNVSRLSVPAGEASKDFAEVARLCTAMTDGGVTRRDLVVALGGGVVGDLAGFVASVCLRGLSLVQVPTSLLAMVDSSVGGKTGVNLPAGKNLAGAFYQPGVVLIDPDVLTTLSQAEYRSGMAEVIKHSLIQPSTPLGGNDLLETLSANDLDPIPSSLIADVLRRNVAIKHSVVQADERESGLRMILNFGHTAGHAIEADGYRYRHGEAVALGMVVASRIAQRMGRIDDGWVTRATSMIERAGLPTRLEGEADSVIGRLSKDKKNVDGALHWILPREDGIVEPATGVPLEVVRAALVDTGAI